MTARSFSFPLRGSLKEHDPIIDLIQYGLNEVGAGVVLKRLHDFVHVEKSLGYVHQLWPHTQWPMPR